MSNFNKGKLYLLPTPIADQQLGWVGDDVLSAIKSCNYYIVERAKTARACLKQMYPQINLPLLHIEEFDKNNPHQNLPQKLNPLILGNNLAIMSEAGNPCIADPGSLAVMWAHEHDVEIIPLIGPSSILLALISSGFNGQNFAFHGYLSNKKELLGQDLKKLEQNVIKHNQTQIFMDTPYRNQFLFETLCKSISSEIKLCIAHDIGGDRQWIKTMSLKKWKTHLPNFEGKYPAIFLIGK